MYYTSNVAHLIIYALLSNAARYLNFKNNKPSLSPTFGQILYGFWAMIHLGCQAQDTRSLPQNDSLRAVYQQKFAKYLPQEAAVKNFVAISDTGIAIYTSATARQTNQWEYSLSWQQVEQLKKMLKQRHFPLKKAYENGNLLQILQDSIKESRPQPSVASPAQPLRGWRIALDPGHFGGNMTTAKIEGKYIEMNLPKGVKISFFESELAWYTARILQKKLSELGAEVMLTRSQYGYTAYGYSFEDWYEQYKKNQLDSNKTALKPAQAFVRRFFRPELFERARLINAFAPDLTLIIHYNVESNNVGWKKPVTSNQSMAFVGGGFQAGELNSAENRFHFLRVLLSDEIDNSIRFSEIVLQKIADKLAVPIIQEPNNQAFLQQTSLPVNSQGVYARNLTMTRQVWGTLCYIEPLYQDNEKECRLLNRRNFSLEGRKIPRRIVEVAEAYLAAILDYTKK
ncbi:MAG: N-acetylmuramoyl-L-alanine amidase [Microscillaceae bacterium]|jgi:N-acetylmuramoyl-L-alanine amidase|nr:N-acetylmuramoyl-L-alanine amidase [Microscillaceae bacterium]